MLNLDTNIVLRALTGGLAKDENELLRSNPWSMSAVVLWELAKLNHLGRITLNLDDREVRSALGSIHLWPIDLETARISTTLDVRGDPADEIIGATSIVHKIPLLTRDRALLRSKVIPLATSRRGPWRTG